MKYKHRELESAIQALRDKSRGRLIVITRARQVGKHTIFRNQLSSVYVATMVS